MSISNTIHLLLMNAEIIVVSGLPRSGTSLMMQMLDSGGIDVVTDEVRSADTDNPRGYYELERVKQIQQDASWLPETRGKAFKMVSQLLYHLPSSERYRIVFMDRDLDEVLVSQEKMLERLGRPAAPRDQIKRAFVTHLEKLHAWLPRQANMQLLRVSYNDLVQRSDLEVGRIGAFLGLSSNVHLMRGAIDPLLYRNRNEGSGP
jgi:hypothetical protein